MFQIQVTVEQWYYQNVQYVVVKKSRFIKNQEAKGLLRKLGVRMPLRKGPILRDILFWMQFYLKCMLNCIKMNEISFY